MAWLSEVLKEYPRDEYIALDKAIELFPVVEEQLNDPTIPTIQISRSTELRLPSADEVVLFAGGLEQVELGLTEQKRDERYRWTVLTACSYQPMSVPEISRFAARLGLPNRGRIMGTATGLHLYTKEIEHADDVVFLRKGADPEQAGQQLVYIQPNRMGFLTKQRGFGRSTSPKPLMGKAPQQA